MEPKKSYHLYTHANGSENLFRNDENFRYFLKRYEAFIPGVADTLAYCLMPNHLHLLVRIKGEAELKTFFKSKLKVKSETTGVDNESNKDLSGLVILQFSHLFNAYTKAYNKFYNRRGSLFTRAFRRKEIINDSYFTNIIHYIHHNPLHHGFVKQLTDWHWSSYQDFLLPELTPVQQQVINWFGNRQQFVQFHQQVLQPLPEIIQYD